MEYATNAKANAALTTGIIGTSLGAIASARGYWCYSWNRQAKG